MSYSSSPLNFFKIDYDGTVFEKPNQSVIGVVIRDNKGLVIASSTRQIPQAYQATMLHGHGHGDTTIFEK